MAYSELIKNFDRIRDCMRQFYVYGFKSRTEYDRKSARSYDNERRRAVELLDQNTVRYCTDVYDASELLPWLRTFTGRIEKLECSDPTVVQRFYDDLAETAALYGGEI